MSAQDQKLMIPLITRNELIYKTLNPDSTDNPYDSVVRYTASLGPELPVAARPCLPDNLCCSLCKELCMRAIRLQCCNSQVCRTTNTGLDYSRYLKCIDHLNATKYMFSNLFSMVHTNVI